MIGDIDISDDEYGLLMEYLGNVHKSILNGSSSIADDPMLAVALVQIGIRHYDGSYWDHAEVEAGVSQSGLHLTQKACHELQNRFQITLKKHNKLSFGPGNYVKTILHHGFVCDHYADQFFNFLFAFYRIDLNRNYQQCDREAMNSLMETIMRSDHTGRTYFLVQQTADAIRANPVGSRSRIRWFLRLMDQCFWEGTVPVTPARRYAAFLRVEGTSEIQDRISEITIPAILFPRGEKSYSLSELSWRFSSPGPVLRILLPPQNILFKIAGGGERLLVVKCGDNHWQIDVPLGSNRNRYHGRKTIWFGGDTLFSDFRSIYVRFPADQS